MRPEFVPAAYREQFQKLQSEVPGEPFEIVQGVIESELGPIQSLFSSIEREPCGNADFPNLCSIVATSVHGLTTILTPTLNSNLSQKPTEPQLRLQTDPAYVLTGAASIGQAHKGVTLDGKEIVLKVCNSTCQESYQLTKIFYLGSVPWSAGELQRRSTLYRNNCSSGTA